MNMAIPSVTMVLMGRTGNGKSATGNTILGRKAFESRKSSSGVTKTSQLQTSARKDGQVINVIDTPGMFIKRLDLHHHIATLGIISFHKAILDFSSRRSSKKIGSIFDANILTANKMCVGMFNLSGGTEFIAREIVKCTKFASEGIHAVLLVFSLRTRFTQEEEATIQTLQNSFGPKIVDYAIVVLTGGDELDDDEDDDDDDDDNDNNNNGDSLEDYLSNECPVALKDILAACKNRCVVFDNKTKSEIKKEEQVSKLLGLVNEMIAKNGGQPYKPCLSRHKLKKEFDEVKSKLDQSSTQDLYMDPKLEEKLNEMMPEINSKFQRQLEEERERRRKVEERSQQTERRYRDENEKQNEELRIAAQRPIVVKVEQDPHPRPRWCQML